MRLLLTILIPSLILAQTPITVPSATGARVMVGNVANSAIQIVCINPVSHVAESCAGTGGGVGANVTITQGGNDAVVDATGALKVLASIDTTGLATEAKQDTGNTSLASIDSKITAVNTGAVVVSSSALPSGAATVAKQPAFGTAGTSSADVITVQGRAAMTPLLIDGSGVTQPVSGTVTTNAGTNLNTSLLALEAGGNLASIKAKTDNIPAQGQALAAASLPVVLTAAQISTLTPLSTVTANAGTNLNTSLLALEAGGNLAAHTTSLQLLDDAVATTASAITTKGIAASGTDGTNARVLKTDTGGELQVDVLTIPALVASSANIGDVDVLTVPTDPFGANADAASATGSISAKLRFIASTGIPVTGTVTANATLTAETTKVIGTVRTLGNVGAVMDGVNTAATAPANGLMQLGIYNSTEPSPTTGQSVGVQLDAKGRQRQVIMDAAGNTRGANVDANSNLGVVLAAETTKVIGTVNQGTSPWIVAGGGTAGSAASGVVTVQGIASMTPLFMSSSTAPVSTMNSASANSGVNSAMALVFDDASPTAITENSFGFARMSANRNQYTTLRDAAGNERGANVDANNNLGVVLAAETTKVIGTVNPGNTANTTAWIVQPIGGTTNGNTNYVLEPAASDNHAVVKAGAGTVYSIEVFNNSATVNYIRLYNATTGFNGCNSATNLTWEGMIPANTSVAGAIMNKAIGLAFSTGISICVTSGYGQTNTSNATASAMAVNVEYK